MEPHTTDTLADDFRKLGITEGDVLLMHSSMKSIGFVVGGTQAVVTALLRVLGPLGTLVVPTHTPENCDPAGWQNPPVPEAWWETIRQEAPGFDAGRTPSRWMGVLAETVRTWPGAQRSNHPQVSFAAIGPQASTILDGHRLDDALGETSPLGAVNRLDGKVLLLGCDYSSNTSLHLAEWRLPSPPRGLAGASVRRPDGTAEWITWTDVLPDEDDFDDLGAEFPDFTAGPVGNATAKLMSQRALVDFAVAWMIAHR